ASYIIRPKLSNTGVCHPVFKKPHPGRQPPASDNSDYIIRGKTRARGFPQIRYTFALSEVSKKCACRPA
ncbi:MAG: hypothetical protein KKD44_07210, partial [Proteobacteria bacterium]|nr:hypothetical protein [Pseudomonadota bacterium]